MTKQTGVVAALAFSVALGGCHKKKAPEAPTPTPPASVPVVSQPDTAGTGARRVAEEAERARTAAVAASAETRNAIAEMIFFDYDRADVRPDMQDILNRKVAILRANPNLTLQIAGHADERGTVEYNLALSLRRANVVRDYITGFGIDASRLEVTGYGEEKPLDSSVTEEAYGKNRRAEFQITRGGDNLVPAR